MIFDDRYKVFLADTPESRKIHFSLRYKVYFEETGWEKSKAVAQKRLEQDKYDPYSAHFLVYDCLAREWMAGLRLVVSPYENLPMARSCQLELTSNGNFDVNQCVEVSRLFVLPNYRCGKQRSKNKVDAEKSPKKIEKAHTEIMLGLIRAAREYGLKNDLKSWFFLVEPRLARRIQRMGIGLIPCGETVNHRGLRVPFYGEVESCFTPLFARGTCISEMFSRNYAYHSYSEVFPENNGVEFAHQMVGV